MKTQQAIDDFLHSRLALNLSQETINWYRTKFQRFARVCPKFPKDRRPIDAFLASLKPLAATKKYSAVTKQNYFNALRALFRFISEEHDIRNPMAKMHTPRDPERKDKPMAALESEEMMRLLLSSSSQRDRAILTLFIDTGMRSGELAGLRKQDIGTEIVTVCGKSGKRQVPISEDARRLLLPFIAENSKDDHLFHGHKGPLGRHGVYRIVRAHMEAAGIQGPKLGPHRIRHGFGKNYLVNGGDLRSLQLLMGHKRITTTQIYTNFLSKEIIEKHHKYSPLGRLTPQLTFLNIDKDQAIREAEEIIAGRKKRD